jgi:molybdopterin-containing oxidoreductase family iron-sulfur binding subunit
MLIDLARCAGCCGCVVACQMQNNTRPGVTWVTVDRCEWGAYPDAKRSYLPHSCMQCDNPPCVAACPTGASYQNEEGITLVNYEDCICCGQCVTACPYGARHTNDTEANWFDTPEPAPYEAYGVQRTDVTEKCIFCNELLAEGRQPACVINCPGGARVIGDVEDPESDIAKKIAGGAKRIGETGFYYLEPAGMPSDMIVSKVMSIGTAAAVDTSTSEEPEKAKAGINPVVVGGGAVVAAAAAVGIGVAVKKSNDRKKADDARRADGTRETDNTRKADDTKDGGAQK